MTSLMGKALYYIYFDSGTTYSRSFLVEYLDGIPRTIDSMKKEIGSKDISITEENLILIEELKRMYETLLIRNNLKDSDVQRIYASGMVTSPFGVVEVPHVSLPVDFKTLVSNIYCHYESHYFKRDMYLIRGIKNISPETVVVRQNISEINSARGEEFEAFGVLELLSNTIRTEPIVVVLPGSHTQMLYIKNNVIRDVLSTISGELFYAISTSTVLSSSILKRNCYIDKDMLSMGMQNLKKYGFNRALYLVNTMKVFSDITNVQKTSYLEGVITGGVIMAMENALKTKWMDAKRIIVAASEQVTQIYTCLIEEMISNKLVNSVVACDDASLSVNSFFKLLQMDGEIK